MRNIRILDCTLRDGGRIVDCKFENGLIKNVSEELSYAGIEIIELGFLRDNKLVDYTGNSTFFTSIEQMDLFIPEESSSLFCAFIDYNMFDFDTLPTYRGKGVEGIRVGFTKKQYRNEKEDIIKSLKKVKEKGYKLFVQSVNTPGYSDMEILELLGIVNDIKPYGFGIVDTYGALYLDEMTHLFGLVNHNLDTEICIDIHSHNNMQSSFTFAQEVTRIGPADRRIIFDATLNGMGKCAGNLNTELIVDYLNRKNSANYSLDRILDIIDTYLEPIKEVKTWGYSIPAFMAGIYKSHPNNIIYLTEKYRLRSKDIKYILSGIDEDIRQRYDYDNIARVYRDYFSSVYEDKESIKELESEFKESSIVVLAPGATIKDYGDDIKRIIREQKAVVVSINFIPDDIKHDYVFCANTIHWSKLVKESVDKRKCILSSNIKDDVEGVIMVNYSSLIEEDSELPDNSTIMLLNLLSKVGVNKVFIAGFDGIKQYESNYVNNTFVNRTHGMSIEDTNRIISLMYRKIKSRTKGKMEIVLITPSLYDINNEL